METKKKENIVRGFFVDGTGFVAKENEDGDMVFPCRILISPNIHGVPAGAQVLLPLFKDKSFVIKKHAVEKICENIHPDLLETYKNLNNKISDKITLPSKNDITNLGKKMEIN